MIGSFGVLPLSNSIDSVPPATLSSTSPWMLADADTLADAGPSLHSTSNLPPAAKASKSWTARGSSTLGPMEPTSADPLRAPDRSPLATFPLLTTTPLLSPDTITEPFLATTAPDTAENHFEINPTFFPPLGLAGPAFDLLSPRELQTATPPLGPCRHGHPPPSPSPRSSFAFSMAPLFSTRFWPRLSFEIDCPSLQIPWSKHPPIPPIFDTMPATRHPALLAHQEATMPTSVKNDKGLFSRPSAVHVDADAFEAVAAACSGDPLAQAWVDSARAASFPQKIQWLARAEAYPLGHALAFELIPGGFSNETHLWAPSSSELLARWGTLATLRSEWDALSKKLKHKGVDVQIDQLRKQLPTSAALARARQCVLEDLGFGWEARGGMAWAIWMGVPGECGYMDDHKRPAGAASARLFESAAAAERTANAAKFGSIRGPAAIVRVRVECVAVAASPKGARCESPRLAIAEREARELLDFLEEASLDDIRLALGEPSAALSGPAAAPPPPPPAPSLAGRQTGYACWVDPIAPGPNDIGSAGGFVNIRGDLGPLAGAVLKSSCSPAAWAASVSFVQVACSPDAIESLIGQPWLDPVRLAIDTERSQAAAASLARQSADALRQRAAALSSGRAAPRRRAGAL